jgi:hypothetical protein
MSSTHRSAMGKPIDMSAIRSRNEKVRAIGNMSVNARGDIIDSNNQVVKQNTQRVNRVYNKATVTPTPKEKQITPDLPAVAPSPAQTPNVEPPVLFLEDMTEDEIEYFNELDDDVPEKAEAKTESKIKKK